mgnify:CR=1 FL=1
MVRKILLVLAVVGASFVVSSGSEAQAGRCYRGGGYGGYYGGPAYYRSARYYGGPAYYRGGPAYYRGGPGFYGPGPYYRGGSGVYLSFGF